MSSNDASGKKRILLVAGVLGALALVYFGVTQVYQQQSTSHYKFLSHSQSEKFVRDYSVRMGAENAPVYLIEFLDPACESCRAFYPVVKDIMKEFEGKVQLVVRYAAFHKPSAFAITVLEAAREQDLYWELLGLLFEKQPEWASHHHPRAELIWDYARDVGLDMDRLKQDMKDAKIQKVLQQDNEDLTFLKVKMTPTFFANGTPLRDFSIQGLKSLITSELEAAEVTQ